MDWIFGSKPTLKDQQRANDRVLRKANRDVERERRHLEMDEKKLEQEIKKMAKEGNKDGCIILAKQLVNLRKQKSRTYAASGKIQSVGYHNKAMGANMKLADAMSTTAHTMSTMNTIMNPEKIAADMRAFSEASMKMEMTDEMINDTLDDIMASSDEEQETDQVVQQVLDEIGIEISGKMARAPAAHGPIGESSKSKLPTDEEIEAQLAKLRA